MLQAMKIPLRPITSAFLVFVATAWSAEPIVVKQHDVVFPGFFGFGRPVTSETLILPGASSVLRQQRGRDRREALREAQDAAAREQQRHAEARRKAEAESMAAVAPAPADAPAAESSMAEASSQSVLEPIATSSVPPSGSLSGENVAPPPVSGAEVENVTTQPAPATEATPAVEATPAEQSAPAADGAPAVDATPAEQSAPAVNSTPSAEQSAGTASESTTPATQ